MGALTARQTTMSNPADPDVDDGTPQRAALADTMARRLVAELRERGWLATLTDGTDALPEFVPAAAMVRKRDLDRH